MTFLKALHHIRHNGKKYSHGQILSGLDEKAANRLVDAGAAFVVGNQEIVVNGSLTITNKIDNDQNNPQLDNDNENSSSINNSSNDYADPREEIEDNYDLDELKATAKTFNMEFPANITKKNLLNQIIDEGKEKLFLDLLED